MFAALLAGAGGLLPTISRIGASFAVQPEQALPHWHILIALGAYFLLGVILNLALNREGDFKTAVFVGIAAPALLTNIIAGVSNAPVSVPSSLVSPPSSPNTGTIPVQPVPPSRSEERGWPILPNFIHSAFAQNPDNRETREMLFSSSVTGNLIYHPGAKESTLIIRAYSGSKVDVVRVPLFASVRLGLPRATTSLHVSSNTGIPSATIAIPAASEEKGPLHVLATVVLAPTARGDTLWALGTEREGSIREINLRLD